MSASRNMARLIRISVKQGKAGLFYARSPELKGLLVAAPTPEELKRQIPVAIRDLYIACGMPDVLITPLEAVDDGEFSPWVAIPGELARKALAEDARA